MSNQSGREAAGAEATREKILLAAQGAFSRKGYAHTGIRNIAAEAGVAPSLVIKYFDTKANLFELALVQALDSAMSLDVPKEGFGRLVVDTIENPEIPIMAPAMLVLSVGDEEAREIATRAASKHIIASTSEWLGTPDARAKATAILMISTGLSVFQRYMPVESSDETLGRINELMAGAIQAIVDQGV